MKSRFACLLIFASLCAPAAAGDFSEFRPIGFSADGGVFAFEEFGVEDGSGFPYANRFFIDTTTDRYLEGTPIRVRLENGEATLAAARAEATAKSSDLMLKYAFDGHPGTLAAFNPQSSAGDPYTLTWRPLAVVPDPFSPFMAVLTEKDLPPTDNCKDVTPAGKGFTLQLTEWNGAPADIILSDDESIPSSRACPAGYRLGGVMTYPVDGDFVHAFLVQVRSFGFEGENGRWIAVTRRLGFSKP